ncbi:MAG: hypothetical protein LBQ88_21660 [Treponema sp.]|jgi:hypothetical protein|nr:hypothetical protein [Treponema sp.]
MTHNLLKVFCLILLLFAAEMRLAAAEISVPRLEFASRGAVENGEFVLSSNLAADIALNGGYKYGVLLGFSLEAGNLGKALAYKNFQFGYLPAGSSVSDTEYNSLIDQLNDRMNNQAVLSFRVAEAAIRNIFQLPLDISYFIGIGDSFCSGSEFTERFGTTPIASSFQGFFYFPKGIGGNISHQYDGIHGVRGTGLSLSWNLGESAASQLYLYQDFSFLNDVIAPSAAASDSAHYSGDLRFLINQEKVKLEGFMGITTTQSLQNSLRGGVMAWFSSGRGADFFLQCGIPDWETDTGISIDNLYFLIEPRLKFKLFSLYVTFFYHPFEYLHIKTLEERGKADINVKLFMGDIASSRFEGGLETTMGLNINGLQDFALYAAPFISLISDGLRWDAKIRVNPLELNANLERAFDFFIGIRTAY